MDREHAGFGGYGRRIRGGREDEIDVAGADLLQHLRLLAELRAGELVDDQRPVAQLLQLVGEGVCGKAVGGGMRLIVAEAEVTLGGAGALSRQHQTRGGDYSGAPDPSLGCHRFLPGRSCFGWMASTQLILQLKSMGCEHHWQGLSVTSDGANCPLYSSDNSHRAGDGLW